MHDLPMDRTVPSEGAPWWQLRARWLYESLVAGALPDHDGTTEKRRLSVEISRLGSLTFSEGRLIVADPYLMGADPSSAEQRMQASPYEVAIARATISPGHDRNAAALLVNASGPIVSWDMLRWAGQDLSSLGQEEFFGYGVDAGTGCFADLEAARVAGQVLADDAGMLDDPISRALLIDPVAPGAAVVVPKEGEPPVAVFSSGWGDGMYPTWVGLNERSDVVIAITDFLLTGDPYASSSEPVEPTTAPASTATANPAPPPSKWKRIFGRS